MVVPQIVKDVDEAEDNQEWSRPLSNDFRKPKYIKSFFLYLHVFTFFIFFYF